MLLLHGIVSLLHLVLLPAHPCLNFYNRRYLWTEASFFYFVFLWPLPRLRLLFSTPVRHAWRLLTAQCGCAFIPVHGVMLFLLAALLQASAVHRQ